MPLGKGSTLSEQEASDVADFMNSYERPQDPRFTKSVAEACKRHHDIEDLLNGKIVSGICLAAL